MIDLDPALLDLTEGVEWEGDATWQLGTPGWDTVVGATVDGFPALGFRHTGGPPGVLSATLPVPGQGALHMVVRVTQGTGSSPAPGVTAGGWVYAHITPAGRWKWGSLESGEVGNGVVLVTLASTGDTATMYVNGTPVGTSPTSPSSWGDDVELANYGGSEWDLLRLKLTGTTAGLAVQMADLMGTYGLGGGLESHGLLELFTGVADLTVLTPDSLPPGTPPDPPAISPGGAVDPPPEPEPQDPPLGVPKPVVTRYSPTYPAPTLDAAGFPVDWTPTTVVQEDVGTLQVVVEGVDITYLHGVPTPIPVWSRAEPFGSIEATITLPQVLAWHEPGEGSMSWCKAGANVTIRLIKPTERVRLFTGVVTTFGHQEDTGVFTLECLGVVMVNDLQLRQPAFSTAPKDVGRVIAQVLNSSVSRRHNKVTPVVTGCRTAVAGGWEPRVTGFVQQLLATAVTDGKQWTVQCEHRTPVIVQKDTTTVSWRVRNGQPGVSVRLVRDASQAPNVIYASGVDTKGGRWQNAMYPNWRPDDTPPYPFNDPNRMLRVGVRDQDTDTGDGVSVWQAKAQQPVTGTISWDDQARAREIQQAAGILANSIIGPQTWASTFDTGANTGTLECFYMPVAYAPEVMPRLYGPDGDDLGPNPKYDPGVLRVEDRIEFGEGVSKREGRRAAKEILARDADPGWVGTVEFQSDPIECSRFEVREGSNGVIRGFRGGDLRVHVAGVQYGPDSVTATVDTHARDFPKLDAIRDRERNAVDPGKLAVKRLLRGRLSPDRAVFDSESPAGQLPKHAVFRNLWDVRRIPFGTYGTIVRTVLRTSGPASPFCVGVFGKPVTAADLLAVIGNPLTAKENPWSEKGDELDRMGLLMAWGWAKQPLGYFPREYTTPDRDGGVPVTGRFEDDASWEFASEQSPWLWVATIAAQACFVEGRFYPGADL